MNKTENHKRAFDIIIPVYNKADFIGDAILSILKQDFYDFKLIVIDDGSTDNSQEVIAGFNDERILYVKHEKNKGVAAAMNTGLNLCEAKYIVRLDADDLAVPERLSLQWKFMEANSDIDFSSGHMLYIGSKNLVQKALLNPEEIRNLVLFQTTVFQGAAVWRRDFLEENHLRLNENIGNVGEDWEFWIRCLQSGKGGNLDHILIHYRQHDENISGTLDEYYRKRFKAVSEIFKLKSWPEKYIRSHFIFQKIFPMGINKGEIELFLAWCDYLNDWAPKNDYSDKIINAYILERKRQLFFVIADNSVNLALFYKRRARIAIPGYLRYSFNKFIGK